MTPDQLVMQQLAARLKRVKGRIVALTAEAEMIERMLADAEKSVVIPRARLRKNSKAKWSAQGQIRLQLTGQSAPVRAAIIFESLKRYDPALNASTFRSHLKRMVEAGVVKHEGPRGHYSLVKRVETENSDRVRLRRVTIGNDFLKIVR